jgi:hypothetical protein
VRLTLGAKVANDLGSLQKSLKSLAERLGHPSCATGCDILHLGLEREFYAQAAAELNPQPLPPHQAPTTMMSPGAVTVAVPAAAMNDIDALAKITATVLGKLGCGQCCSGFDILLRRELDLIAVDEKLNAQGYGRYR